MRRRVAASMSAAVVSGEEGEFWRRREKTKSVIEREVVSGGRREWGLMLW